MIRKSLSIGILILLLAAQQVFSESALSSLGYGLPQSTANARASGMGLVSLAMPDTLGLNMLSAAAWNGPATTRFGFSGYMIRTSLENNRVSENNDQTGLTGAAMVIPLGEGRFFGLALSPYTRMCYKWEYNGSSDIGSSTVSDSGRGGLTQCLVSFSTAIKRDMRLGFTIRPIFGQIYQRWGEHFDDDALRSSGIQVVDRFIGLGWGFSWQLVQPAGWAAGVSLLGPITVNVERQTTILVNYYNQQEDKEDIAGGYDLPWDIAFGAGRAFGRHRAGFEFAWQGWSGVNHASVPIKLLEDALRYGIGWEWAPDYRPFDPFWREMTYRGGLYYQDHYALGASGYQSHKFALTGGMSIPYYDAKSRIDLALEIGWMGDRSRDKVTERTVKFSIGFNHSQKWFIGRREKK